jgi:hypothetical protein
VRQTVMGAVAGHGRILPREAAASADWPARHAEAEG